jgi:hypothetical protein
MSVVESELQGAKFLYDQFPYLRTANGVEKLRKPGEANHQLNTFTAIQAYLNSVEKRLAQNPKLLQRTITRILLENGIKLSKEHELITRDQKATILAWLDHLSSPECQYPNWVKFYIYKSILRISAIQKKLTYSDNQFELKSIFKYRNKNDQSIFPVFNVRALDLATESISNLVDEENSPNQGLAQIPYSNFEELSRTKSFAEIYAYFLDQVNHLSTVELKEASGHWREFKKGDDPEVLVNLHRGIPLESCLSLLRKASEYLEKGDLHIYFEGGELSENCFPRATIVVVDNIVIEVRGLYPYQNLDPDILEKVSQKLNLLKRPISFASRLGRLRKLNQICQKTEEGLELTRDELIFLYTDFDSSYFFGIKVDPRINLIKNNRTNYLDDIAIIHECSVDQISNSASRTFGGGMRMHLGNLILGGNSNSSQEMFHNLHIKGELEIRKCDWRLPKDIFKGMSVTGGLLIIGSNITIQEGCFCNTRIGSRLVLNSNVVLEPRALNGIEVGMYIQLNLFSDEQRRCLRSQYPDLTFV